MVHFLLGTGITYRLVLALGLAWPARESARRAVERAQSVLPAKVRRIDELAWLMPNAVALPLSGVVAFTKTAADEMNDDELHAIALHEIGHLRESAIVRWSRPARSVLWLPLSVAFPLLSSGRSTSLIALLIPCMALSFVARIFSRRHEAEADAESAAHSTAYARALETLHRLAGIPAVISKHATHPSLYDRMLAAGVQPDFPRPRAPNMLRSHLLMASTPLWMFAFAFVVSRVQYSLWNGDRERAALVGVAMQGSVSDLLTLARETDDERLAELLYARVAADAPYLLDD